MLSPTLIGARSPAQIVRSLASSPQVREAFAFFETHAADITRDHIALSSVPSPPFGEAERARVFGEMLRAYGLSEVSIDAEGNCVGLRRRHSPRAAEAPTNQTTVGQLLIVSAHLDTVFPPGTDCTVRVDESGRLHGPGVADDGCGLAALLALLRALEAGAIETARSILFVGTVGEEGEGNLRGVRHLLTRGEWAGQVGDFISFDGPSVERITHVALGSRRYRLQLSGPGGHSWGDFGVPNPIHAAGRVVARLASYPAPRNPRTTYNVGRINGGTGVNVIAREVSLDIDLRSQAAEELRRLDAFFRRAVREAVEEENYERAAHHSAPLAFDLQLIGDRPGGETSPREFLVRLAEEATRACGHRPALDCSSTDANIPISLGVPAITIGAGGACANSHTLDEWYDPAQRAIGLKRGLLVTLGAAGMI